MSESRTIRVIKRDGSVEAFDEPKLTAAMWAAMEGCQGEYEDARELARAVRCFVHRIGWLSVATAAIFEMSLKIMRRVQLGRAAAEYETFRQRRKAGRKRLRVIHDAGQITAWDKAWLAKMACRVWNVSTRTGRILAGQVEGELLADGRGWIRRRDLVDMMNASVLEFGLGDAVPVERSVHQT